MKTILAALIALVLLPSSLFAAESAAEPTIYENTVLAIKFYDVADLLKYKGADKKLLARCDALKRAKITAGVVLLNRIENITDNKYGMSADYPCVILLGKQTIRSHADVEMFAKSAKPGQEYAVQYHGYDGTFQGSYTPPNLVLHFTIKK